MLEHLTGSRSVKLGLIPTRRTVFSKEAAQQQRRRIEHALENWKIDFVALDWLNDEGLLYRGEDCEAVVHRFRDEEVDCVFAPHCNFGTEDAVAKVGRDLGKPFLLWGPRDPAPDADGNRPRDTQCGLFATSKALRRLGVPFTYIINSDVDDPVFERGLRNFLAAARVVRALQGARIGQVATRPAPFWSVIANEGELLERWGVELVPVSLAGIISRTREITDSSEVTREVEEVKERVDTSILDDAALRTLQALKLTLLRWADEQRLHALALQCWSALQECMGIFPCFVDAELTELGLPVACETDVHGALTALMLQAAAADESPTFCADLTNRHPENENAELLWHCGPFPLALADPDSEPRVTMHFTAGVPATGGWRIRGGDMTLARLDGDHGEYSLLIGHCRGTDGPFTTGTYVWAEVDDWPRWEEHIIYGPYIHHVIGVHGKLAPVLHEACRYLGITPDPVTPGEEAIRRYLRGQAEL